MATANFKDSLLKINKISEEIITIGVAPRWNHPRNFGGTSGA
jgi:hypothetical protein